MVSKTSISALNTVDIVLIIPFSAKFCLISIYRCGYANFRIFHFKKLLKIVVHIAPISPPFLSTPPPTLTIGKFSNFSRKKGLSNPVTPNSVPSHILRLKLLFKWGWGGVWTKKGGAEGKGGQSGQLCHYKHIYHKSCGICWSFFQNLQSRQNILSILSIKFQSHKVWSVKNQISAANRLKNGTSKIVVSKISISALNTVYIANKSPFAEFGLRSRYCCRNTQIFVLFIKKKLCTCIS